MEELWSKACEHYKVPEQISKKWYEKIKEQLSCIENRAYHNWNEMILRKAKDMTHLKESVVLAIFFQYYYFKPHEDCAQENCVAFKEFCSDANFDDETSKALILTLLGDTSIERSDNYENEKNILQDVDLAILGASDEDYKHYTQLLRCEYSDVTNECYKSMRIKVLEALLMIPNIFSTDEFQAKYETKSRKNIQSEIEELKQSIKKNNKVHYHLTNRIITNAKKRLNSTKRLKKKFKRNNKKGKRFYKRLNFDKVQTASTRAKDDDCICIEPRTECVIIDEDSNGNDGCVDLTNTYFGPEVTSSPNIRTLSHHSKMLNNRNAHTQSPTNQFFRDVSKMPWFSVKERSHMKTPNKTREPDVIVIDDSIVNTTTETEKDESIKYISWSGSNALPDFIPIQNVTPNDISKDESVIIVESGSSLKNDKQKQKCKKPKLNDDLLNPCTSKLSERRHNEELFTRKEKKLLNEYNQNTYNPHPGAERLTKKRMVIVDASNVAFNHSLNHNFSVKGLIICIDYFVKMGHEVKAVLPQYRLHKTKSSDPEALEKLRDEGKVVLTPCKNLPGKSVTSYDDRFILQLAYELDAAVISNDNYRDLINENPAFKKIIENRVVGYTWCNDIFLLPKDPYGKMGPTLESILNRK